MRDAFNNIEITLQNISPVPATPTARSLGGKTTSWWSEGKKTTLPQMALANDLEARRKRYVRPQRKKKHKNF